MQAYHGIKAEAAGQRAAPSTARSALSPTTRCASRRGSGTTATLSTSPPCATAPPVRRLAGIELWYGGPHAPATSHATRRGARLRSRPNSSRTSNPATPTRTTSSSCRSTTWTLRSGERSRFRHHLRLRGAQLPALQFLSPWSNKRTDEYGGSFENRARFWRRASRRCGRRSGHVRHRVRFAVDSLYGSAGVELEKDGIAFVEYADHLVDLWDSPSATSPNGAERRPVAFLRGEPREAVHGRIKPGNHTNKRSSAWAGSSARTRWWPSSTPASSTSSAPPALHLGPFLRTRSPKGASTTSGSASAATSASHAGRSVAPDGLHAERHRGEEYRRGWHPDASTRRPTPTRASSSWGQARRHGVRHDPRQAEMSAVHLVEAEPEIGGHVNWVSSMGFSDGKENIFRGTARGSAIGSGSSTTARSSSTS